MIQNLGKDSVNIRKINMEVKEKGKRQFVKNDVSIK